MLTPEQCTVEGLCDYATSLYEVDILSLTEDQFRIILLAKTIVELGTKIQQIQELLRDD